MRLTNCPYCDSKSYTALEKPSAINRLYICRVCSKLFRKLDARRKERDFEKTFISGPLNNCVVRTHPIGNEDAQ